MRRDRFHLADQQCISGIPQPPCRPMKQNNPIVLGALLLSLLFVASSEAAAQGPGWQLQDDLWLEDSPLDIRDAPLALSGLLQAVPAIEWHTPEAIGQAWSAVKGIDDPALQHRALRAANLEASACFGLVDFREIALARDLPIRWRDKHRGRTWVDPATASTLLHALEGAKRELPGSLLAIGDMSQPGCGQLEYGTLVQEVRDQGQARLASELLNRSRLLGGIPGIRQVELGSRGYLMTERTLVGHTLSPEGELLLRVAVRRYRRQGVGPNGRARHRLRGWDQRLRGSQLVELRRVRTTDEAGHTRGLWRSHWISRVSEKQLILFSTSPLETQTPLSGQLGRIVEMRFSRYVPKKPLSFRSEQRWVKKQGSRAARWEAWRMIHEAGHQTHTSGRDVDISYVTHGNTRHFTGSWKALDGRRTWQWFRLLEKATVQAGSRIERVLVGPRARRVVARRLSKVERRSRLFSDVLRSVEGHEGHHHLRIAPAEPANLVFAPWLWRMDEPLASLFEPFRAE